MADEMRRGDGDGEGGSWSVRLKNIRHGALQSSSEVTRCRAHSGCFGWSKRPSVVALTVRCRDHLRPLLTDLLCPIILHATLSGMKRQLFVWQKCAYCDVRPTLPNNHAYKVTNRDIAIVLVSDATNGMQPIECLR